MKILAINNTVFYEKNGKLFLNGETGRFFLELWEINKGLSVFQISQPKTPNDSFANFCISDTGIPIVNISRNKNKIWSFIRAFFKIPVFITQHDFIYVFYPGPICQFIAVCCILLNKKYGVYVRGQQNINTRLSKLIFRRALIINTISPAFTSTLKENNKNTFTIRPMISLKEDDIVEQKTFTNKTVYNLLYVGRLVFDKGLFELLDAVISLRQKGYDITLTLVGDGTDREKLKRKVAECNIENLVTFAGMVSEVNALKKYYNSSDIFILPTYHEGFPRVLYEALIMGIPIITTFVGGIGFLMKDKYNCLEIKPQSSVSIVERVEQLINNIDLRQQISENGTLTIRNYLQNKKHSHATSLTHLVKEITPYDNK